MPSHDFPRRFTQLEPFAGPFSAFRLRADECDVLFASYPAGTVIEPHQHETENWGLITKGTLTLIMGSEEQIFDVGEWYHVPAHTVHAARFAKDTAEIEFWFRLIA